MSDRGFERISIGVRRRTCALSHRGSPCNTQTGDDDDEMMKMASKQQLI